MSARDCDCVLCRGTLSFSLFSPFSVLLVYLLCDGIIAIVRVVYVWPVERHFQYFIWQFVMELLLLLDFSTVNYIKNIYRPLSSNISMQA